MSEKKLVIMGAAGRDFHNFQTRLAGDATVRVVAFTATQIPGIDDRRFPATLAGPRYPDGIPIVPESELPSLIEREGVDEVVFAYSDIAHVDVMHKASLVLACGADFTLLGPDGTMLEASVPVVSVCAVRTGVGKSGINRRVWELLDERGVKAVAIRHPMPYRDLSRMAVERYGTTDDLDRYGCTIEEREEYEHLIARGIVVFAGVDYAAIVVEAAKEADVLIWDGGNNDMPFVRPDLEIVALDPHRPGHERLYHPGEVNFLRADVLVVNKVDSARPEDVEALVAAAAEMNPDATLVKTRSCITVEEPGRIEGARVLAIEDGPTVTHGGMAYGAGALAAKDNGAVELVDPRPYAVGSLADTLADFPHLTEVLPAMGYSTEQLADLEETIRRAPCDLVLVGTPIDLTHLIDIDQPALRVTYSVESAGEPSLETVVEGFVERMGLGSGG